MNTYYCYDEYGKEIQAEVFDIIKSLSCFNETSTTKLCDTPEAKELIERMINASINMLFIRKIISNDFTVFSDKRIKEITIDDEMDSFNEKDTLDLYRIFEDERYFHELVAKCFISNSIFPHPLHNHIFYINSLSKFCENQVDFFTYYKDNKLYVRCEKSEITLTAFVNNYLGFFEKNNFKKEIDFLCQSENNHANFQKKLTKIFRNFSQNIKSNHDFLEGSICFFDFLGWKGLWQNRNTKPLPIVTKLIEDIKGELNKQTKLTFPEIPISSEMSRLISISDTIAIFTPKVIGISKIELLILHAKIARYILESSCKIGFPIRGAITYGEYSLMNNIMIGPGIDECASWHETCNWIGAHFTPSAQFILDSAFKDNKPNNKIGNNIISYAVPLKAGLAKLKYCVNWNITNKDFDKVRSNVKAILPDIAAKYLNTYDFLTRPRKEELDNGDGKD